MNLRRLSLCRITPEGKENGEAEEQRVVRVTLNNDHDQNTIHHRSSRRQRAPAVASRTG